MCIVTPGAYSIVKWISDLSLPIVCKKLCVLKVIGVCRSYSFTGLYLIPKRQNTNISHLSALLFTGWEDESKWGGPSLTL